MITIEALRGYILEELLAQLLHANGYRLLVSANQDPDALKRGAHGLLVRGRGTDHQADVLGELTLPTPFSQPLRIFVEAKYRAAKTDLRDVRNAHGVVHDVNEQYATATAGARSVPMRRYHYRFALFSAAGFSRPAQQFALAQQISLIDLSSSSFTELLNSAHRAATELHRLAGEVGASPFPRGQMRTVLRLALGTWTADEMVLPDVEGNPTSGRHSQRAAEFNPALREPRLLPAGPLTNIADGVADQGRGNLLLGFPSAPFVLVLRPDDRAALVDYVAQRGPDIRVTIEFSDRREVTGDWIIVPADGTSGFRLRFALPALLEDWLLGDDGAAALRARDVKVGLLSSISMFLDGRLVRLLFRPRRRG